MRILLTGGTGFLGQNIQESLGQFMNQDYSLSVMGSSVYDLRCQHACRKMIQYHNPDVIVHAAGSVGGIGANKENPGKFMYENLIMGTNLIERARIEKIPKFILLGTVCAYPKHTPVPFAEESLWDGYPEETNAPYGIAKKTLMRLLQAYGEQYGMRGANLIPVNMYGPHDHFNLTSSHVIPALILKFYNAMRNGENEINIWGTGKASREFLYAPDCVEAIARAIETEVDLNPINIGTGKEITINDLVYEIGEQMGWDGVVNWQTDKPDGQPRRCLDTNRAKKLLDFEAKTSLKTGLKQTIEWFLNDNNWEIEE
jgi:GDP-L-fucose synthase